MFNKKDNGKLKVNWDAMGVLIVVVGIVIGSIVGYTELKGQSGTTTEEVAVIKKNTTENVPGTLKNDVEKHKEINTVQDVKISVLESSMAEVKKIQDETRRAITDLNKKIDTNQRDLMNAIMNLGKE